MTSTGWLGRLALEARETGPERLQNVARLFEILRGASAVLRDARLPFLVARLDVLIQAGDDPATADAEPTRATRSTSSPATRPRASSSRSCSWSAWPRTGFRRRPAATQSTSPTSSP